MGGGALPEAAETQVQFLGALYPSHRGLFDRDELGMELRHPDPFALDTGGAGVPGGEALALGEQSD